MQQAQLSISALNRCAQEYVLATSGMRFILISMDMGSVWYENWLGMALVARFMKTQKSLIGAFRARDAFFVKGK